MTEVSKAEEPPLYERLQAIDLGNGVAEHDRLLWNCLVYTQHFTDLSKDRIDLILGSKGAGKSSLFRMFGEILENNLRTSGTVVVTGVETKGEPIFKAYADKFHRFSEAEFEAFWKLYLLSLVYNKLLHDENVRPLFEHVPAQLAEFETLCKRLGLVDVGRITSATKLLKLLCELTIAAVEGVTASWNTETNQIEWGVKIREKIDSGYEKISTPDLTRLDTVLCIDALAQLAEASKLKLWMMLDHLDIVFKRRSPEEARALRALLKVSYAFTSDRVRLKIFLRDDILDAISGDNGEPLAGLSHITARAGANLKWTADSLCVMIVKRFANDTWLSNRYEIDGERLDDVDYARATFHELFAFKYKTQLAFDWIISLLSDGRGVVTPRDLIDLLKAALHNHSLWLQKHPENHEFMKITAVQEAHKELSKNRKETVLNTEFSHLLHWIRKLEGNKEMYLKDELAAVFEPESDKAISMLKATGVILFDSKKACYRVAKLYGPGLGVYATRARRGSEAAEPD